MKVVIIEIKTNTIVESIPCRNMREAERVERGVNINLNHSEYFTTIEEE
ncbi:hypothetical protein CHOTACABRAS_276 [Bacillus phage Chotacabras]|nr:hypothetical protein CHOTACABRAS_276 [Bacillus phage Chotacabras]